MSSLLFMSANWPHTQSHITAIYFVLEQAARRGALEPDARLVQLLCRPDDVVCRGRRVRRRPWFHRRWDIEETSTEDVQRVQREPVARRHRPRRRGKEQKHQPVDQVIALQDISYLLSLFCATYINAW